MSVLSFFYVVILVLDGSSLQVIITIQLLYVLSLDVTQQYLSVYVEQEIEWQDVRLRWDPADYGGLDAIWVLCDQVWTTDLFNCNSLTVNEIYPDRLKQCKVHSNGSIHSDMFLQMDSACPVDVQKFPFDKQTCAIPFVTTAFQPKTYDLQGKLFTKYIGFTPQGNGEWNVLSLNMTKDSQLKSSSDNNEFNMLVFNLELQREPSFYFYVITLPCFLLTFLSIIGCFWTPNHKEEQLSKLSIALTSMMSMTTFIQMVSDQLPKTKSFPLLGIFVLICVFLISISCVILVAFPERSRSREVQKEKDPKKRFQAEIRQFLLSRHFGLFGFFQAINLINFIVFMSFWD